jgi:hypothetical protein
MLDVITVVLFPENYALSSRFGNRPLQGQPFSAAAKRQNVDACTVGCLRCGKMSSGVSSSRLRKINGLACNVVASPPGLALRR